MWTKEEVEYIKENGDLLEKATLPLSQGEGRGPRFCTKLNIALAVIKGKKFKLMVYGTRNVNFKVAYLQYSTSRRVGDGLNIAFASFRVSETEAMRPEAFKEYLIYKILADIGFDLESELPYFNTWVKLVNENIVEVVQHD